jgi:L-serine dehydratase
MNLVGLMKQFPSIFNDVIGPLMVGQSSSHTAASVRIGSVIRQLAGGTNVKKVTFSFDTDGSLATTFDHQGSDVGLLSGLLGFETHDKRIKDAYNFARDAGIQCSFEVKNIGPGHPNAYYVDFISQDNQEFDFIAVSTGGGMIRIIEYMGFPVNIDGGFFETLILCDHCNYVEIIEDMRCVLKCDYIVDVQHKNEKSLINVKTEMAVKLDIAGAKVSSVNPVLPVLSKLNPKVPFITAEEIVDFLHQNDYALWELAILYESERSGLSGATVLNRMKNIMMSLVESVESFDEAACDITDRILPNQWSLMENSKNVLGGSFSRNLIKHVTRFMDIKTSMGMFLAAPTAGACGCLSGTVFALSEEMDISTDDMAKAMLSAGLVGILIAHHSTFAGEVCGCQAECGSGSGMCAAACAEILNLNARQCMAAASMALQNIFGMVCDPVGNKVEVPCLGKNIMAAFNAVACANMIAAGYDEVIPLDETIFAMDSVGRSIPRELRCTGLAGLSVSKTGLSFLSKN